MPAVCVRIFDTAQKLQSLTKTRLCQTYPEAGKQQSRNWQLKPETKIHGPRIASCVILLRNPHAPMLFHLRFSNLSLDKGFTATFLRQNYALVAANLRDGNPDGLHLLRYPAYVIKSRFITTTFIWESFLLKV
jgi:hypothetical protein